MKEAIIFFGPPGSGKGTQVDRLEERLGYARYTMSTLINLDLKKGEKEWTKSYSLTSGFLLDDDDVIETFHDYFKGEEGVILDGIPRQKKQATWLRKHLESLDYKIRFIYMKVDESVLLERILKRAKEQGRGDDNEETFKIRLGIYEKHEKEVLDEFRDCIVQINGNLKEPQVEDEIMRKLGE